MKSEKLIVPGFNSGFFSVTIVTGKLGSRLTRSTLATVAATVVVEYILHLEIG